ncbi:type III-A CRISPR-associated RAMP protein Csm4 [Thioalkalivibrio paradoxus]|uniref:CRISPR system Cms protein Csm4 n=1 Tax=Thioalkalivibrio paradoxus ARh 1 TaxID=713585 RepID=W0DN62_9GAMM|nr:hypothetical protein [Thioalkalivibrio paradoxus]AHE98433.1 hypothetical protein THITH_09340 [Thioalkalivibrio paradoxus ARh 1]
METLRLTLRPRSAFGGPLRGDTLFGQLCWAVRNRRGEEHLRELLDGYTQGRPFAVCSDAFPAGFLPRPALPLYRFRPIPDSDRKAVKKRRWLPLQALARPVEDWLHEAMDDAAVVRQQAGTSAPARLASHRAQPHNSIDRRSGTTGPGAFAPYTQAQYWYAQGTQLDLYLLLDPERIGRDEAITLLDDIGRTGYGRDASIGLGKFDVTAADPATLVAAPDANACFTLAPCAPQGLGLRPDRAFYEVFTRFGRHGDRAVYGRGGPFKTPVLLAGTGGLFAMDSPPRAGFLGQGLGGAGRMSKTIPETVQQGYAPCAAVRLNWEAA